MTASQERPDSTPEMPRDLGSGGAAQPPYVPPPGAAVPPSPPYVAPPGAGQPPYPPYAAPPSPAPRGLGERWSAALSAPRKSVALACFLSMMPGLGQVYLGYYQRGFIYALVVASDIALLSSGAVHGLEPLFGLFLAFFWMYNIVDAGRRAAFYNMAVAGMRQMEMPEDFKMPSPGGSLVGGLLLAGFGVLLLLYTRFDFDLYWLHDWWPLALVILGLNLAYNAAKNRRKKG